jgi:hypothetical protein
MEDDTFTTKEGKLVPRWYVYRAKAIAKAKKNSTRNLARYDKVARIFEQHGWDITDEGWAATVKDVIEAHKGYLKTEKEAEELMGVCYNFHFLNGNPSLAKSLKVEVLENARIGMEASLAEGKYSAHQGYLDRLIRIVYPELKEKQHEPKDAEGSVTLIKQGNTQAMNMKAPLPMLIEALRQLDVKQPLQIEVKDGQSPQS